jgi:hypothetical protein
MPGNAVWPRTVIVVCDAHSSMPISPPEDRSLPGPHRPLSKEFHPFLNRVVGKVGIEKLKAIVRGGRPADSEAILPVHYVATSG